MRLLRSIQLKLKPWPGLGLGLLLFFTVACGSDVAVPPETAASSPSTAATPTGETVDATPNQGNEIALQWTGSLLPSGEPGESCHNLTITAAGQAMAGPCDGERQDVSSRLGQEWRDIVTRFAPFETENPDERIVFKGQGELAGPVWERAVTAWARLAAAQLSSGQVSATGPTVLAWNLGEVSDQPGVCQRLIGLIYGYATAALTPCEGGDTISSTSGWIDPADWEQFDAWLYANAPVYQDDSYLDGRGTAEMSQAEISALTAWAQMVYEKIS